MGGDMKSAKAKATRDNLANDIGERRAALADYIRQLRQRHGDAAVNEALARLEQRDRIAIAPRHASGS
jgi:hypothetical protein